MMFIREILRCIYALRHDIEMKGIIVNSTPVAITIQGDEQDDPRAQEYCDT